MKSDLASRMLRWAFLPECEKPIEGWAVQPLTIIGKVIAGQSPPSDTYNDKADGLPFLQGNGDFTFKYPEPTLWCSAPSKTALKGDTLISVRAPVGEVNWADRDYAIGRGLRGGESEWMRPEFPLPRASTVALVFATCSARNDFRCRHCATLFAASSCPAARPVRTSRHRPNPRRRRHGAGAHARGGRSSAAGTLELDCGLA